MTIVRGDGPVPNRFMIVGERPGVNEHEQGRAFVGDAGQELWSRIRKILRMVRSDFYVTNLVKTFSTEPPTADEIQRDAYILRAELLRVRPTFILTIGYHAARAFLPQFATTRGDVFHGLGFPFVYGPAGSQEATIVPCCHSAAALRQPDRYQNQLSDDLRAFRRIVKGVQGHHRGKRPAIYRVGLAGFGREGMTLGVDTEGDLKAPEAVTLAHERKTCCCVEVHDGTHKQFLAPSLSHAKAWAIHYALHDVPILKKLGVKRIPTLHCTMLQAYLLGLPQSLKVLAYRELGFIMDDYLDLVEPLDEALVKDTLQARVDQWTANHASITKLAERKVARRVRILGGRVTKKAIAATYKRLVARSDTPPMKVVSSLKRMIERTSDAQLDDTED